MTAPWPCISVPVFNFIILTAENETLEVLMVELKVPAMSGRRD